MALHRLLFIFSVVSVLIASIAAASAERRVALVIGNSSYASLPLLKNAAGDGRAIAGLLTQMGFEVVAGFDMTKDETQETMAQFARTVRGADLALFFYAGHGLQVAGRNYLLPTDAVLEDETSLDFEAVSLNFVLRQLSRDTKTRLVFLDACRDNPLVSADDRRLSQSSKGLAEVQFDDGGTGTLIAFATSPNEVAFDGGGEHSPFAAALLEHLDDENVQLTTVMTRVTGSVFKETGGKQRPWVNASLIDEVLLNAAPDLLIVGRAPDLQAQPDSARRSLTVPEPATPEPQDEAAMAALRAQIPSIPEDGEITFARPLDFGEPALDGKSIAELIKGKPAFPPIEGLDKQIWDTQCTSCHAWTQATLCEQARTYDANDVRIMRLPHPLGARFKVALARWAHGGCL